MASDLRSGSVSPKTLPNWYPEVRATALCRNTSSTTMVNVAKKDIDVGSKGQNDDSCEYQNGAIVHVRVKFL